MAAPTQASHICDGALPTPPATASDGFRSFTEACLRKDAAARAGVWRLLSHGWLADFLGVESEEVSKPMREWLWALPKGSGPDLEA